jgi:hypothetical protein
MTAAEKQRRYRERKAAKEFGNRDTVTKPPPANAAPDRDQDIALKARIAELEQERDHYKQKLKSERTRTKLLEEGLRIARRQQRVESKPPKAAKPPLPPDEVRDRKIKAQQTTIQNLRGELRIMERHYAEMEKRGIMSPDAVRAIAKALHPDHAPSEAERVEACKRFMAWKADSQADSRRRLDGS